MIQAEAASKTTRPRWSPDLGQKPVEVARVPGARAARKVGAEERGTAVRLAFGELGRIVGIKPDGGCAEGSVLFEQPGLAPAGVVAVAHTALERAGQIRGTTTGT